MPWQWSKRSLDNMRGIHPDLRRVCDHALYLSPIDFTVIEGLRSRQRQLELYERGASRTLNSRHITGHAVDLWPINPFTGLRVPGDDPSLWEWCIKLSHWVKLAAVEQAVPINWGGDWRSFPDGPHYELVRAAYP